MSKRKEHKIIDDVEMKHCSKCKEWKQLEEFGKDKKRWDGLNGLCKTCNKSNAKTWYKENREDLIEYQKQHYKNNKDAWDAYMAQYANNNYKLKSDTTIIYGVYSKHFNRCVYIGNTSWVLNNRIAQHKYESLTRGSTQSLHKHIRDHGWDDVEFFEVCKANPKLNNVTEHDAAVVFKTYEMFNDSPCNGAPKEFVVSNSE